MKGKEAIDKLFPLILDGGIEGFSMDVKEGEKVIRFTFERIK